MMPRQGELLLGLFSHVVHVHKEQLGELKDQLLKFSGIKALATTNPYEVFRMQYNKELIIGYSSGKIVVNGALSKKLLTGLIASPESAKHDLNMSTDDALKEVDFIANIDGLCEPKNPGGIGSYGLVIYSDGKKIHEEAKVIGKGRRISNNLAEYSALVALLQYLIRNSLEGKVLIRSDSQLVINQMNGTWEVTDGLYIDKWYEARMLRRDLRAELRFEWIEREENSEADKLSRQAYEAYCEKHGIKVKYHDG